LIAAETRVSDAGKTIAGLKSKVSLYQNQIQTLTVASEIQDKQTAINTAKT
jgi:hypothetical protein